MSESKTEREEVLVEESSKEILEEHKAKVSARAKAVEALLALPECGDGILYVALRVADEGLCLLTTEEKVGGTYFAAKTYERRGRHEWEPVGDYFKEVEVKHYVKGSRVRLVPEEISEKARELSDDCSLFLYGRSEIESRELLCSKSDEPKKIAQSALKLMHAYLK